MGYIFSNFQHNSQYESNILVLSLQLLSGACKVHRPNKFHGVFENSFKVSADFIGSVRGAGPPQAHQGNRNVDSD